jgi:hypothetical protein
MDFVVMELLCKLRNIWIFSSKSYPKLLPIQVRGSGVYYSTRVSDDIFKCRIHHVSMESVDIWTF